MSVDDIAITRNLHFMARIWRIWYRHDWCRWIPFDVWIIRQSFVKLVCDEVTYRVENIWRKWLNVLNKHQISFFKINLLTFIGLLRLKVVLRNHAKSILERLIYEGWDYYLGWLLEKVVPGKGFCDRFDLCLLFCSLFLRLEILTSCLNTSLLKNKKIFFLDFMFRTL